MQPEYIFLSIVLVIFTLFGYFIYQDSNSPDEVIASSMSDIPFSAACEKLPSLTVRQLIRVDKRLLAACIADSRYKICHE